MYYIFRTEQYYPRGGAKDLVHVMHQDAQARDYEADDAIAWATALDLEWGESVHVMAADGSIIFQREYQEHEYRNR